MELKLCSIDFECSVFIGFPFELYFLKYFIYLFDSETASERGNTGKGSGRGRSRLPVEEPDGGLDPRTLGSRPEPKADA